MGPNRHTRTQWRLGLIPSSAPGHLEVLRRRLVGRLGLLTPFHSGTTIYRQLYRSDISSEWRKVMCSQRGGFDFGAGFPFWGRGWGDWGPRRGRGRRQMFEAGEIKFVILRLLKEKPRHGYEIIKALEERMAGCYTPSPGTVYPTLQMLEDQGYVRAAESGGKKVYEI